jgi:hypothetical protein
VTTWGSCNELRTCRVSLHASWPGCRPARITKNCTSRQPGPILKLFHPANFSASVEQKAKKDAPSISSPVLRQHTHEPAGAAASRRMVRPPAQHRRLSCVPAVDFYAVKNVRYFLLLPLADCWPRVVSPVQIDWPFLTPPLCATAHVTTSSAVARDQVRRRFACSRFRPNSRVNRVGQGHLPSRLFDPT